MQTQGRLRLKSQVIARTHSVALNLPFARVWVDTGVFHLDGTYDYSVPEQFTAQVNTGVRVQVPFNGREVEAIVLERVEVAAVSGAIKSISKVLSIYPVATKGSLALIERVAKKWGSSPFDIIRSAIPSRVASVDKGLSFSIPSQDASANQPTGTSFIAFIPHLDPSEQIVTLAREALTHGSVLVIAPDESDIDEISQSAKRLGVECIRLDSSLARAQRYSNFLKAMSADGVLVIGARGAVFTPVGKLATVIVYKESSHELYEIRNPGWNVRDVLLERKEIEEFQLYLCGYVPTLETSVLIEEKKIKFLTQPARLTVKAFASDDGTLLPGRIFTDIRKALAQGPVLFVVARKGYGNALLCAHCKNIATCTCGARLVVGSKGADASCSICLSQFPDWRCTWCNHDKKYLAGRGIERAAEEISRAFPQAPIILSYGDVIKRQVERKSSIVLATPGAVPKVTGGYCAVVILEGIKLFSHPDLRAQERARELFFETAAMTGVGGAVLLCIDDSHPIVSSLMRWNPSLMIQRELEERLEIPLPPYVTSFVVTGPTQEFSLIARGIQKAIEENRIPSSVRLFGPLDMGKSKAKIVLYCPKQDASVVTGFMHELQRRRSVAQKEYLALRIDPYTL